MSRDGSDFYLSYQKVRGTMARQQKVRIVSLFIIGAIVMVGTGMAYRALMAPWRGDVREPLVAAFFVGVTYFICCNVGLRWAERRERHGHSDRS
jgi:hypothetical protein